MGPTNRPSRPSSSPPDSVEERGNVSLFGPQENVSDTSLQVPGTSLKVDGGDAGVVSPVWLQRLSLVVFVVFCIELGMLLTILPWTRVWTDNSLIIGYPHLRSVFQNNFFRGVVSGLGLIDLWIGIWDAIHYKEKRAKTGSASA